MGHYSLIISKEKLNPDKKNFILSIDNYVDNHTFTYNSENKLTDAELDWFKNMKFSLDSLSFHKEMYKPGCIHFKMQIEVNEDELYAEATKTITEVPEDQILEVTRREAVRIEIARKCNITNIKSALMGSTVILDFIEIEKTENADQTKKTEILREANIADQYYIFEISPKFKFESKRNFYIEINAYSPDKYLTLNRHCASYTGKKLSDIFKLALGSFKVFTSTSNISTENLQHLNIYNNDKTQKEDEYILPYVIQYNENTHDFLTRIASRYGEFLYYENGLLNLGLKILKSDLIISTYESISTECITCDSYYQDTYNSYLSPETLLYPNSTNNDELAARSANSHRQGGVLDYVYSDCATDEYLEPIKESDFYKYEHFFAGDLMAPKVLVSSLSQPDVLGMAEFVTESFATAASVASVTYKSRNKEFIAKHTNDKGVKKEGITYNDGKRKTDIGFCSTVRLKAKQVGAEKMSIIIGNYVYNKIYLGSEVTIPDYEGTYIVIAIKGSEVVKKAAAEVVSEAARKAVIEDKETTNISIEITVIPKAEPIYPHSIDIEPIRSSASQKAVVVDNVDPCLMNRVRIRYPWQPKVIPVKDADGKKDIFGESIKDASPWLRLAMPMASAGHGFSFTPEIGDEVIVNYEGGNIERPYIEGSLYTKSRNALATQETPFLKTISSTNGHKIKFYDNPDGLGLLAEAQSLLSLVNSFIPIDTIGQKVKELAGYTEITDTYGFYSVKMSTEERQVSISSPFGDVIVNALTGISLIAPNGNIKIKGKNISIEAGNNLELISGNNIVTEYFPKSTEALIDMGKSLASATLAKVIDISLIRTIVEIFLRPIGGTMLIKSNRYICMEAGKGKATILNDGFRKSMKNQQYFKYSMLNSIKKQPITNNDITNALKLTRDFILNLRTTWESVNNALITSKADYTASKEKIPANATITDDDLKRIYEQVDTDCPIVDTIDENTQQKTNPITDPIYTKIKEAKDKNLATDIKELYNLRTNVINCSKKSVDHIEDCWTTIAGGVNTFEATLKGFLVLPLNYPLIAQSYIGDNDNTKKAAYRAIIAEVFVHACDNAVSYKRPDWVNYEGIDEFKNLLNIVNAPMLALTDDKINLFNEQWHEAINKIVTRMGGDLTKSDKVVDFIASSAGLKGFLDQNVWDQANAGEVLISNKLGSTLHFNANGLEEFQPAGYGHNLLQIKEIMKQD